MALTLGLPTSKRAAMGRVHWPVQIDNYDEPEKSLKIDALVDTGAAYLVLPSAWKDRLGKFARSRTVELEMANQDTLHGEICGPAVIQLAGFDAFVSEVLFIEMLPQDGHFEPLIGYTVLELSQATVDMMGHRLLRTKHADLK